MSETKWTTCLRCGGCGRIANSPDGEAWTHWQDLPPGSDIAVRMGLVAPIACPECGGTGLIQSTLSQREAVVELVFEELRRAETKHPGWPENTYEALAIIGEEFGELQQAALQAKYEGGDPKRIQDEAVQLAAMALRFLFNLATAVRS